MHYLTIKMAKDSLYVVGPKTILEALTKKKDVYQTQTITNEITGEDEQIQVLVSEGWYNKGAILQSLDGKKLLLEEAPEKFAGVMDKIPQITTMTESEAVQYLADNSADWFEDPELI